MSALAGLSQQIISASQSKTPEKALSKNEAVKSSHDFDKKLKNVEPKIPKDKPAASKDYSAQDRKSSSPEKTLSEKRIEERAQEAQERGSSQQVDKKKLTKQEAMWAFLDRMDQELGVQPDQVMNAFAKLDVDNLVAPPETSADEFVENLNLQSPGQEDKALNLYSQLLTWTSAASLSEQLQKQGQHADMAVMSSKDYQVQQRMEGLNDLSDKFFMNGNHTRENLIQSRENIAQFAGQNQFGAKSFDTADNLLDMQSASEVKPPVNSTDDLLREMSSEALTQSEESQLGLQQKLQALKSYGQPQQAAPQPVLSSQNFNNLNLQNNAESVENILQPHTEIEQAVQAQNMSGFTDSGEGEAQMDMSGGDFAAQDIAGQKNTKATGADFMVKAPQPTETEMSENIREIINKAKVMVKDGGGEMKVSLRPEGMGNVNLKVNVVGGDVRVEMITASDETRKVLERGLGELKDSLSLQKLNVDQIKVESMQEAAEKLMEQKQEQAERNFQERFLQDFKNQNQSKWGGLLGVNPIGRPESQGLEEGEAQAESKSDKSRRLDLVA